MPAVTNDLFKVVLKGTYFSQVWNNVHWYYNVSGVGNLNLLNVADSFEAKVLAFYADVMAIEVTIDEIRVSHENGVLADVIITPSIAAGVVVGTPMAPFMAARINLERTTKETRIGRKMILGLIEENTGATSFAGTYNAELGDLGTALEDSLDMGGALDNLLAVIVRTVTPTTWIYNLISGSTPVNQPTTQNSRKIGAGI